MTRRHLVSARTATVVGVCASALVLGQLPAYALVSGPAKWVQLSPATHPGARYSAAMAYDGSHALVLFGGYNDATGFLSDTWVWDGSTWTNKNPAHHPSARDGASMAYDSASQTVILFGGENGTSLGDTWSWNGTDWTQRTPTQSAPKRAWGAMAVSPTATGPILFGGLDASALADTWKWDNANNTWTQITTAHSPGARSDFTMALDSVHGKLVVFGGGVWSGDTLMTQYGDTWTFDGTDWTQAATTGPHARIDPQSAFDPRIGRMVLFGGFDGSGQVSYQDTWSWSGTAWTALSVTASAAKRDSGAMAYLPGAGKTVVFGGMSSTGANLADTWVLTLSALTSAPALTTKTSATRTFVVNWGAPGAVVTYTVQYAQRVKNSSGVWVTGAWNSWKSVGAGTRSASFTGSAAVTYLFHAKATYADGSTSGFSSAVTSVVPLDERSTSAVFSSGWVRRSSSSRYLATVTDTTLAGKTMTINTTVHAYYLVGDKCTTCGKLSIYVDGKLITTIDTHASSLLVRQTLFSRTFTGTATHRLTIKTLGTAGRPRVGIDAIGIQR